MPLPHDLRNRIIKALADKSGRQEFHCPICLRNNWILGDFVNLVVTNSPTVVNLSGKVFPLVPLICSVCGNTQLLNLKMLGFTDEELKALKLDVEPEAKPD